MNSSESLKIPKNPPESVRILKNPPRIPQSSPNIPPNESINEIQDATTVAGEARGFIVTTRFHRGHLSGTDEFSIGGDEIKGQLGVHPPKTNMSPKNALFQ